MVMGLLHVVWLNLIWLRWRVLAWIWLVPDSIERWAWNAHRISEAEWYGIPNPKYEDVFFEETGCDLGEGVSCCGMLARPGTGVEKARPGTGVAKRGSASASRAIDGTRPTILVRTPYGSNQRSVARLYAERGFNYVILDTRGRFQTGGDFIPVHDEIDDGATVIKWAKQQPWFDGSIGTHGMSYLGMTSWAMIGARDPALKVGVPVLCAASIHPIAFPAPRAIALELITQWTWLTHAMHAAPATAGMALLECMTRIKIWGGRKMISATARACNTLPMTGLDVALGVGKVGYIQEGIRNMEVDSAFWKTRNHLADLRPVSAGGTGGPLPCSLSLIAAWHDFFLEQQLRDFQAARATAEHATLTVFWAHHWDLFKLYRPMVRCIMQAYYRHLFALHFCGRTASVENPNPPPAVRLELGGGGGWRGYSSWPPEESSPLTLFLGAGGARHHSSQGSAAAGAAAGEEEVWSYVYDASDPTPSIGGPSFNGFNAGVKLMRPLEWRKDVLTFDLTPPLTEDVVVVGEVTANMLFSSDLPTADLLVKLCDVDSWGVSRNVAEGYVRLVLPDDTPTPVRVVMATAYKFKKGHRIRALLCSGAHPRIARNLGVTDKEWECVQGRKGIMRIHSAVGKMRSSMTLPICQGGFFDLELDQFGVPLAHPR